MYEWGYYTLLSDRHMCELGGQENCDFSKTYFNIVASSSSGATKNSLIADVDGDHILLSFEGYAWYMSLAPLLDCTAVMACSHLMVGPQGEPEQQKMHLF